MFDSNIPSHNFSCVDRWALSFCQDRLVLPKASITSKGTPYHGALIDYTAESMDHDLHKVIYKYTDC